MFGLKDNTSETINLTNNSDTEEVSNDRNSQQFEVIDCKPNINSFFSSESDPRAGPSFQSNESLSASEDFTNQSTDLCLEDKNINSFVCEVCNQVFDEKLRLQNHLSKKHRIKSFECELCPYKTYSIYHLKRHKTSHSSDKPFKCMDGCEKWFKTKEHLYEHKNLKHSDTNPFVCHICSFKTGRKASFNYHMRLHYRQDSSRPFKCSVIGCNKTYTKKVYLDSHKSLSHSKS